MGFAKNIYNNVQTCELSPQQTLSLLPCFPGTSEMAQAVPSGSHRLGCPLRLQVPVLMGKALHMNQALKIERAGRPLHEKMRGLTCSPGRQDAHSQKELSTLNQQHRFPWKSFWALWGGGHSSPDLSHSLEINTWGIAHAL